MARRLLTRRGTRADREGPGADIAAARREGHAGTTLVQALSIPLAIATVSLLAWFAGFVQPLDDWLSAQRFQIASRAPSGQVVLVALDAKTLSALGTWPLKRGVYADLVDKLRALDVADIDFDVDFSAVSSPPEDDAFAAALERAGGSIVLAGFNQKLTADPRDHTIVANTPIAEFAQWSFVGDASVHPDGDGVVRRFGYGETIRDQPVPSMPVMIAGGSGTLGSDFTIDFGIRADRIEQIPAIDVLSDAVAKDRIAGKTVVVGATAVELRDYFQVPRFGPIPGALLEAASAETLIQGRALAAPSPILIAALLALIAIGFALLRARAGWLVLLASLAFTLAAVEGAALLIQIALPIVISTAAVDLALAAFAVAVLVEESNIRGLLVLLTGRALNNSRTMLDQVIADSYTGILIVDEQGYVEAASRSAARMLTGDKEGELVGQRLHDVAPPDLVDAAEEAIGELGGGAWYRREPAEIRIKWAEVDERIVEYVATPSRQSTVSFNHPGTRDRFVCCLTLLDVTDRRASEARLSRLANFDTITGLANRRQFTQHLAKVLAGFAGNRSAVICLDLDRFKNVNDTFGHRIGDLLLQQVADRIRTVAGVHCDDMAARLGGDEYALLLADRTESNIAKVARDLVEQLGQPYEVNGHRLIIGASAGIALAWLGKTPQEMIKNADTALYRAKADGGNGVRMFEPAMDALLRARQALEVDCWDALGRGEFRLVYQPQVDLTDGRVVGVEALLRWNHPTRGLVGPTEFVGVAEETGLIEILGAWVLKQACQEVASWPGELTLSVNVSPVQFRRGNLVKTVTDILAETGFPADRLDLEITETVFLNQNEAVLATVMELRAMGVQFSLDDFGTGYSSLNYLRKFPVSKIKIDKSFVADMPSNREALAIIRAVAALAQSLGIRLNAEGIEQAAQVHQLRLLGCTEGQGYLFGEPSAPEAVLAMVASGPHRLGFARHDADDAVVAEPRSGTARVS